MASLTHVCMWSENGWKRITAEQAAQLHPGGTVSAHSGLFMCELCGQYVILTDGDIRIRYFKHSAYEKSKGCPERTFGAGYSISYGSVLRNVLSPLMRSISCKACWWGGNFGSTLIFLIIGLLSLYLIYK